MQMQTEKESTNIEHEYILKINRSTKYNIARQCLSHQLTQKDTRNIDGLQDLP